MDQPGWHPDPWDPSGWRWWDGSEWTEHIGGGASSVGMPPTEMVPTDPLGPSPLTSLGAAPPSPARAGIPLGLLVGGGIVFAVFAVIAAGAAVVLLGGGDDGTTPPPDLSDVAVGSDPDESAFCDAYDEYRELQPEASPVAWGALFRRLAEHAYDDESEAFADGNRLTFQWTVEGQRSQDLFDESEEAWESVPAEICGDSGAFTGDVPEDVEQLEEQASDLAWDQDLDQPGNRFFLYAGTVTVVFSDVTAEDLVTACEAWGDEPYEVLPDDGIVMFGQSNDDIDVLEDPVVMRTNVHASCEALDPLG